MTWECFLCYLTASFLLFFHINSPDGATPACSASANS